MTLREAGERVARAGGVVQEADGRLLVSLPGSARSAWSSALEAARRLYLCEPIVLERLKSGKPLPDKAVLPSGKLEP
jgi:hypothetical protein